MGVNGLVFGIAEKHKIFKKDPGRREWTIIIECVSASGRHLQPLVIFKGKDIQQQWFPDEGIEEFKDWKFESSPKGWMLDDITVAGTRGCTWFVRAPSNNCTISPSDKWISRGEARTVGACIEGAGAVPLRPALIPGGRLPSRLIHHLSTKLFRPPVAHNN